MQGLSGFDVKKFWMRLENGKPACWQGHAYRGSIFAESGFAIAERHAAAHSLPTATWSAGWKAIGPSRMRACAA